MLCLLASPTLSGTWDTPVWRDLSSWPLLSPLTPAPFSDEGVWRLQTGGMRLICPFLSGQRKDGSPHASNELINLTGSRVT